MKKTLKIFSAILAIFSSSSALADTPMLKSISYSAIESKIGKGKPFMLEFGSTSCHSCVIMGQTLYKLKQKHPQSNIYFIDVYKDEQAAIKYGAVMIPAQVYLDKNGKVIEKHFGKIEYNELEKKLKSYSIL